MLFGRRDPSRVLSESWYFVLIHSEDLHCCQLPGRLEILFRLGRIFCVKPWKSSHWAFKAFFIFCHFRGERETEICHGRKNKHPQSPVICTTTITSKGTAQQHLISKKRKQLQYKRKSPFSKCDRLVSIFFLLRTGYRGHTEQENTTKIQACCHQQEKKSTQRGEHTLSFIFVCKKTS